MILVARRRDRTAGDARRRRPRNRPATTGSTRYDDPQAGPDTTVDEDTPNDTDDTDDTVVIHEEEADEQPRAQPYQQPHQPSAAAGPKRLTRSRDDRMISGVCGGLARYLNVDATLVRVVMVVALLVGFLGTRHRLPDRLGTDARGVSPTHHATTPLPRAGY